MGTITELLTKASEKLGIAVDLVYDVVVQQSKVVLVWNILAIIGLLILSAVLWKIGTKLIKHYDEVLDDWCAILGWTCRACAGFFPVILIPEMIRECVQILVNPPIWILEYLTNLFK